MDRFLGQDHAKCTQDRESTADPNLSFSNWINVDSYDVYINGDYFGTDVQNIQITTNDILRIDVIKTDDSLESTIQFENLLV